MVCILLLCYSWGRCGEISVGVSLLVSWVSVDSCLVFLNGCPCLEKNGHLRAGEMAQWVKELAPKAGKLNLVPSTHVVERENPLSQVPSDLYMCAVVCKCAYTHNTHIVSK